ncbi:hypothetical protein H2203_006398 [Taxawa tesnikishii (nom. ined.)]|nr:hypothetical protein H2203_006398 [Dothideales sp. JES 119]
MAQHENPYLQRPLYVFDLPEELLYSLELKAQANSPPQEPGTSSLKAQNGAPDRLEIPEGAPSNATSCGLCGLTFSSVQEQRSHVRSDLHGYNLKQKMQLDESISGSDTSSSESSDEEGQDGTPKRKDTTLSALLKKQANLADPDGMDEFTTKKRKRGSGRPPLLWFSSSKLPSNISLGVYRSLFAPAEQIADGPTLVQTLQRKQLSAKPPPPGPTSKPSEDGGVPLPRSLQSNTSASGPHYFLCMIGGGHFAGMLVSLTPKVTKKGGLEDRTATVLASKTFHRYTTRRKQGGSQSSADAGKSIHSAGSSLRRYNETALTNEVRELLTEWKPWIDRAELVFVRATGTTNRRTLFGPYEGQVLNANDERIRGFPFSTRRATQAELMRAFVELTRVKVSTIDEAALKRAEEEAARAAEKEKEKEATKTTQAPARQKLSKEDEEAALHTTQLQSLIRRSKAPGLLSYLTSNSLSADFNFLPWSRTTTRQRPCADPGIQNRDGKSAFDLTGDRATRDAFRLARSELGESKWAWDAAHVPPPLSKAEAEKRAQTEKAEKAEEDKKERERREAEMTRLRKEDKEREEQGREKRFGKGKSLLAAVEKTAQEKREEEARGMTPEMRMRLERERRARAAEARMKK